MSQKPFIDCLCYGDTFCHGFINDWWLQKGEFMFSFRDQFTGQYAHDASLSFIEWIYTGSTLLGNPNITACLKNYCMKYGPVDREISNLSDKRGPPFVFCGIPHVNGATKDWKLHSYVSIKKIGVSEQLPSSGYIRWTGTHNGNSFVVIDNVYDCKGGSDGVWDGKRLCLSKKISCVLCPAELVTANYPDYLTISPTDAVTGHVPLLFSSKCHIGCEVAVKYENTEHNGCILWFGQCGRTGKHLAVVKMDYRVYFKAFESLPRPSTFCDATKMSYVETVPLSCVILPNESSLEDESSPSHASPRSIPHKFILGGSLPQHLVLLRSIQLGTFVSIKSNYFVDGVHGGGYLWWIGHNSNGQWFGVVETRIEIGERGRIPEWKSNDGIFFSQRLWHVQSNRMALLVPLDALISEAHWNHYSSKYTLSSFNGNQHLGCRVSVPDYYKKYFPCRLLWCGLIDQEELACVLLERTGYINSDLSSVSTQTVCLSGGIQGYYGCLEMIKFSKIIYEECSKVPSESGSTETEENKEMTNFVTNAGSFSMCEIPHNESEFLHEIIIGNFVKIGGEYFKDKVMRRGRICWLGRGNRFGDYFAVVEVEELNVKPIDEQSYSSNGFWNKQRLFHNRNDKCCLLLVPIKYLQFDKMKQQCPEQCFYGRIHKCNHHLGCEVTVNNSWTGCLLWSGFMETKPIVCIKEKFLSNCDAKQGHQFVNESWVIPGFLGRIIRVDFTEVTFSDECCMLTVTEEKQPVQSSQSENTSRQKQQRKDMKSDPKSKRTEMADNTKDKEFSREHDDRDESATSIKGDETQIIPPPHSLNPSNMNIHGMEPHSKEQTEFQRPNPSTIPDNNDSYPSAPSISTLSKEDEQPVQYLENVDISRQSQPRKGMKSDPKVKPMEMVDNTKDNEFPREHHDRDEPATSKKGDETQNTPPSHSFNLSDMSIHGTEHHSKEQTGFQQPNPSTIPNNNDSYPSDPSISTSHKSQERAARPLKNEDTSRQKQPRKDVKSDPKFKRTEMAGNAMDNEFSREHDDRDEPSNSIKGSGTQIASPSHSFNQSFSNIHGTEPHSKEQTGFQRPNPSTIPNNNDSYPSDPSISTSHKRQERAARPLEKDGSSRQNERSHQVPKSDPKSKCTEQEDDVDALRKGMPRDHKRQDKTATSNDENTRHSEEPPNSVNQSICAFPKDGTHLTHENVDESNKSQMSAPSNPSERFILDEVPGLQGVRLGQSVCVRDKGRNISGCLRWKGRYGDKCLSVVEFKKNLVDEDPKRELFDGFHLPQYDESESTYRIVNVKNILLESLNNVFRYAENIRVGEVFPGNRNRLNHQVMVKISRKPQIIGKLIWIGYVDGAQIAVIVRSEGEYFKHEPLVNPNQLICSGTQTNQMIVVDTKNVFLLDDAEEVSGNPQTKPPLFTEDLITAKYDGEDIIGRIEKMDNKKPANGKMKILDVVSPTSETRKEIGKSIKFGSVNDMKLLARKVNRKDIPPQYSISSVLNLNVEMKFVDKNGKKWIGQVKWIGIIDRKLFEGIFHEYHGDHFAALEVDCAYDCPIVAHCDSLRTLVGGIDRWRAPLFVPVEYVDPVYQHEKQSPVKPKPVEVIHKPKLPPVYFDIPHSVEYFQNVIDLPKDQWPQDMGVNYPVEVHITRIDRWRTGVCKWIGKHLFTDKYLVGVELDEKTWDGSSDGVFPVNAMESNKRRLFQSRPQHGIVVPLNLVREDRRNVMVRNAEERAYNKLDKRLKEKEKLPVSGNCHPIVWEAEMTRGYGIQGKTNSCYMDSTLLALYAMNESYDFILEPCEQDENSIRYLLKNYIVNPLRRDAFVRCANTMYFREKFEEQGKTQGMTSDQKDAEEFLTVLFERLLKIPPLLEFTSNDTTSILQLFFMSTETCLSTTKMLQLTLGDDKFRKAPSNLIMLIPREGSQFIGFRYLQLDLELDIGPFVGQDSALEKCRDCGSGATYACSSTDNSDAFHLCEEHFEKLQQKQDITRAHQSISPKLELFAVLCIQVAHYVTFLREWDYSDDKMKWYFFDSMADRAGDANVPQMEEIPNMETNVNDYNKRLQTNKSPDPNAKPFVKRLFGSAYVLFYRNSRLLPYN